MLWKRAVLFGVVIHILCVTPILAQSQAASLFANTLKIQPLERTVVGHSGWEKLPSPLAEKGLTVIETSPTAPGTMCAASLSNLYCTTNGGQDWERILALPCGEKTINFILIESSPQKTLYAATSNGLFESRDLGAKWRNLFEGIGEKENRVNVVFVSPADGKIMLAGTGAGLFRSYDSGQTWTKEKGELGRNEIVSIISPAETANPILAATANRLYVSNNEGQSFELCFVISGSPQAEAEIDDEKPGDDNSAAEESGRKVEIKKLALLAGPQPRIYIATTDGLFEGTGSPLEWRKLPLAGLRSGSIEDIVISTRGQNIFVATKKGAYVFKYESERWEELYRGLSINDVRSLSLIEGGEETLIAATADGLYRMNIEGPQLPLNATEIMFSPDDLKALRAIISKEPTVIEVQRAAVRYADVDNGKITWWHIGSRLRALVPSLSIARNRTIGTNIDIDRGGTADRDFYFSGPDDITRYNNVGLQWDLADLIWSSSQTSIDSREKLMVELRDEILSEVTRLYFERRRVLIQLILGRPEDIRECLELSLRLEELTAHIDALTGGYLSRELEKRNINYD
ncbi:MAG: hypothetical protein PHE61_01965 [Candidatus Omnitrophica bacterium]|nr:hypothetical protein [Candidatus Omnitrophota bacterium]